MSEEWRDVPGYEGIYQVSEEGDVRTLHARNGVTLLRPYIRPDNGRPQVELTDFTGQRKSMRVHVVVAQTFLGPRPPGLLACHGDGDVRNNHVDNLRWGTPSENVQDAIAHGTHGQVRKTHCPAGHPYDEGNTYRTPRGHRRCRACARSRRGGMGDG